MNSVMNDLPGTQPDQITDELNSCLQQQRKAYFADPPPDLEQLVLVGALNVSRPSGIRHKIFTT